MSNINNEIQVFNNENFGQVRSMMIDGEPWFVGRDVAEAMGYAKPENAIAIHIDDGDKTSTLIQGSGSNYRSKAIIINESGLYALILSSKLPKAKEFKRWVTTEVLPTIRKTGNYAISTDMITPILLHQIADLLEKQNNEIKTLNLQLEDANSKRFPKNPDGYYTISVIANVYGLNARKLNIILQKEGIQYKVESIGKWRLCPEYENQGYEYIRTFGVHKDSTMLWTDKGLELIKAVMDRLGYKFV